jgi:hypothetical protein
MSAYEVVLYTIIDTTKSGVNENIFIRFLEDLTLLMMFDQNYSNHHQHQSIIMEDYIFHLEDLLGNF